MPKNVRIEGSDVEGAIHPPINNLLDALTFKLARLVALNFHAGSRKFRDAYGLSLNQWRVIGLVNALTPVTFGRIRRILVMDKGQLSRVIKQLTDRGLLVTHPAADDARAVELSLTKMGRELHDKVLIFTSQRNEAVVETLTQEECCEFLRILKKITAHNEQLSEVAEILE